MKLKISVNGATQGYWSIEDYTEFYEDVVYDVGEKEANFDWNEIYSGEEPDENF